MSAGLLVSANIDDDDIFIISAFHAREYTLLALYDGRYRPSTCVSRRDILKRFFPRDSASGHMSDTMTLISSASLMMMGRSYERRVDTSRQEL